MPKGYTSTKDAAKPLGMIGPLAVTSLIAKGELPATKIGRRYFIANEDLERAVAERAGVLSASAAAARIRELEAEVAALREVIAGPSSPAARQRIAAIRAEHELAYGRRKRTKITNRLRWLILERDGHRCRYCGATAPEATLLLDHVLPVIDGGTNDPDNLVTACEACNDGKGSRPLVAPLPGVHR